MIERLLALPGRLWGWLTGLPAPWLIVAIVVGAAAVVSGFAFLYRTYDYIEHDNEFCLSCHLMEDPFVRFERSAHRGLGCKACHKPTLAGRSKMALKQILENPDKLEAHADVPNEKCASCHVDGDPAKWRLIASSAGHRVHLESDDPSLRGLACVTCHSTDIHEFSASDETCGQAGCHEDTAIRLGRMAGLTIHCVACHEFSRPLPDPVPADTLETVLRPVREQCLTCHEMRQLLPDFPEREPHGGACGACHDPHDQRSPEEAVRTCAAGGCHQRVDTVSSFHRGLNAGALAACTSCHTAHDWKAHGGECLACHSDVLEDRRRPAPGRIGADASPARSGKPAAADPGVGAGALPSLFGWGHAAPQQARAGEPVPQQAPAGDPPDGFSHAQHRSVACTACHGTAESHGELKVRTYGDCVGCHHAPENRNRCTACHTASEIGGVRGHPVELRLSVWESARTRALPFRHERHEGVDCERCHTEGESFAVGVTCESCHEEHHEAERLGACGACHEPVPEEIHRREVHLGCGGAGCHEAPTALALPPSPPVCLSCHAEQWDHRMGRDCAACHATEWGTARPGSRRP